MVIFILFYTCLDYYYYYYWLFSTTEKLRRTEDRLRLNLTLVQYTLPYSEEANLKVSEPYFQTSTSPLKSIKSSLKSSHPKEIIQQISKNKGGELLSKSIGQLSRNRQQVYNANKQFKS